MKELRFNADYGVWRVAFAFDPGRRGIILVAGDKTGVAQKRFYKALIAKADARFTEHLDSLEGQKHRYQSKACPKRKRFGQHPRGNDSSNAA
jgi:hypothetical protein